MIRELKVGDTVYTPCTSFNSGEMRLEEKIVKEIAADFIVLTHVATLRKCGEELEREEVAHTDDRGGKREIDYYSRSLDDIMKEYREQNEWFVSRVQNDGKK